MTEQQQPTTTVEPDQKISLATIRKTLPPHIFKKDLYRSLWHFAVDVIAIFTCLRCYDPNMSWVSYIIYANVLGFFMWCLFVVGHDCGHTTFSDNALINSVVGHISHGFLLVPFHPWAKSHAAHHAFHNHKSKDRSHVWFDVTELSYAAISRDVPVLIPIMYPIVYLFFGYNDGTHYFPWGKLCNTNKDRIECILSSSVCFLYIFAFVQTWGVQGAWNMYFVPWLIFNSWLYGVTYLQHHMEGTNVYGDGEWSFTKGAVETVDRLYDPVTGGMLDDVMVSASKSTFQALPSSECRP
jgi:omega-3 fatty acid desaturase (delta-15 desaturase)